jgi:Carboxypeptidase regulatory-like domain
MRMKLAIIVVGILALALRTQAQTAEPSKEPAKPSLEGSVVKDPGGEPVKKAIIEMIAENQGEGGNYTATSDANGHFKITDILPGRYRLLVERTGFIEVDKKGRRSQGSMLSVGAGQEIKGHTLHMLAAAILTGRVLDEDGDPMANVDVTVLRRTGKSYEPNGSAQTNDLGEYRIGGLLAGKYYVAATPLPNFQAIAMMGKAAQGHDAAAPRTSYLRTFYPGVLDRTQASTIDLHGGEETPVDFALARKHAASVRGRVSGLAPGAGGMVMLRSKEASSEFNTGEIDKDGKFEILNVAPGSYMLTAIAVLTDKPQMVREPLEIGTADIEDVQLAPQPPGTVRGRVHFNGKSPEPAASAVIFLHSLDGDDSFENGVTMSGDETAGSPSFAKLKPDGSFELKNVPPGRYELIVTGGSQEQRDTFVESVAAGTKDFVDTALNIDGGSVVLDVAVSAGAGLVDGVVTTEKNEPAPGSVVIAVPEARFRKQAFRYARAETDQNGHFSMRGLRPGAYTIYAWEHLDGDEYLDADFLKSSDGRGTGIKIEKSSHQSVELKLIPAGPEQP